MTTQKLQDSPAYAEQIQVIGRELKAQNRRWPTFAAVFLLLGGVALLLLMGSNFDFPDSCTRVDLGILLFVLFVLWEIRAYRKSKRFAADFYGKMLPTVLKKAYAAYAPRTGDPDPLFFDPAETWRFPTTVTFLVLSMGGAFFHAQGIYRIQREYFKADSSGGNDETGQYRVSQDLLWKVRMRENPSLQLSLRTASGGMSEAASAAFGKVFDRLMKNGMRDVKTDNEAFNRSFRVRADDAVQAELFLNIHGQQLTELRDKMGRFALEYADDMLTLSFSDFAPIDTKDANNIRCTGLPGELSTERIAESVQELDFLADWFGAFMKKDVEQ